jgi:hypothetical protein
MSHADLNPSVPQLRRWNAQATDYSRRLQTSTMFPWNDEKETPPSLGSSLAAHYHRVFGIASEVKLPNGLRTKVLSYCYGHDDLPFLGIEEGKLGVLNLLGLNPEQLRERGISLKERYDKISIRETPYGQLVFRTNGRDVGIVGCICLVDNLLMAERAGFNVEGAFADYLARKWNTERAMINTRWDSHEVNGKIGSLPIVFDLRTIMDSDLANLWRSKVGVWTSESDFPKIIAQEMDISKDDSSF